MNANELIGRVAAAYLDARAASDEGGDGGVARFLITGLTHAHVVAIVQAVLDDPRLRDRALLRIPATIEPQGALPAEVLTTERATYWRNRPCDKPLLVLANFDDVQARSLDDLLRVGSDELLAEAGLWVAVALRGLSVSIGADTERFWAKALQGLTSAKAVSLERFAEYVLQTRQGIEEGKPFAQALGWALPVLRVPRDSGLFRGIPEKSLGHRDKWRALYQQAFHRRAPYLAKLSPTQQRLGQDLLERSFEALRESVPPEQHAVFEAFIATDAEWGPAVRAFAELEWEADKAHGLFEHLKVRKEPLGTRTRAFLEHSSEGPLSEDELEYLKGLDGRKAPIVDDEEFFEQHRFELSQDRKLKADWDRFVFGKPVETSDLRVGLLKAVERLFEQREDDGADDERRELVIECARRTPKDWEEMNDDALAYLRLRYRGLPHLFGKSVRWEPASLFTPPPASEHAGEKRRPNHSTSKVATQLKFTVTLRLLRGEGDEKSFNTQLVWTFDPKSVLAEFANDWKRIAEHPFMASVVAREPVNSKGRLQAVDLHDHTTLQAVFRQDSGSLVARYDAKNDLAKRLREALATAAREGRLGQAARGALEAAWGAFEASYRRALESYRSLATASEELLAAAEQYEALLEALATHAPGDRFRQELWRPVLELGQSRVDGGDPVTIVPPWHPLRLAAAAVKDRRLAALVRHLLEARAVCFGDERLFFRETEAELEHPFYPEVCLGAESLRVLLAATDHCGDYSLMESPTRARARGGETNEDPLEPARIVRGVVEQFLELYPHERANLSVVLFNCDTARLPEAAVQVLSEIYEEDNDEEVRCHVQLRHTDPKKLHALFEALLATSERDADSVVTSESTRDFMARLRVGIMAEQGPVQARADAHPTDIVFLQDVVARAAELQWIDERDGDRELALREHVPSRWSRRRPASRDDLRATTYLCCPLQPSVGWAYLRALSSMVRGGEPDARAFPVPARQINFADEAVRAILDEVHRLGHWVVNYDELMTRQQLRSSDVRIIRHKQLRKGARSLLVSSTAPLSVLEALVRRHLAALALGLEGPALDALTRRLLEEAKALSGDIVLRAARRGAFAHELVGLALSRFLLRDDLTDKSPVGWYFLDDYADWLGQREEHIADVLALAPETRDGALHLTVLVSEAKYVSYDSVEKAAKSSATQLRETVQRMEAALFGDPGRLDRDHWLARLADLLLDGVELGPHERPQLYAWQRALREGRATIVLRGYSHVFVHTKGPDDGDPTEARAVPRLEGGWQEVYGPEAVRDLLLAMHHERPPRAVREAVNDQRPWATGVARVPAAHIDWSRYEPSPALVEPELEAKPARASRAKPAAPAPEPKRAAKASKGAEPAKPASSARAARELAKATAAALAPEASSEPVASTSGPVESHRVESTGVESTGVESTGVEKGAASLPARDEAPAGPFAWAHEALAAELRAVPGAGEGARDRDEAWLEGVEAKLRSALLGYGLEAKVLRRRLTPNAALLSFRGTTTLDKKAVEALVERLLTTHALRVVRVSAEPGAVTVYVARPERETVHLVDLLRERVVDDAAGRCNRRLVVGVRESDGATLYLNPGDAHAPHTLIAGTTGSGKSVLLQNLLLDIALTNSVANARISIIDPKQGVDFQALEGLPHLVDGLVVEQAKATALLERLVEEMDARYRRFKALGRGVTKLADYNRLVPPAERLPVWWLVHDEFAEWMLVDAYKDAVTAVVQRLGVKARAAGIFLIFAAQRPEDRVLPVNLRDNLGNRLVLRVESEGTSMIALNEKGAERLLGRGHLAARLQGEDGLVMAQVPIMDADALQRLVTACAALEGRGA